jgi:hypothetical protein
MYPLGKRFDYIYTEIEEMYETLPLYILYNIQIIRPVQVLQAQRDRVQLRGLPRCSQ